MLKTYRETGTKTPFARISREQESNKSPISRPLNHFFSAEKFKNNIFKSFTRKIDISKTPIRKKDSFEERYTPNQRAFFHNLIGKVSLPTPSFRMTDIYQKDQPSDLFLEDIYPLESETQNPKTPILTENPVFTPILSIDPIPPIKIPDFMLVPPISNKFSKIRKLISSLRHYEQLGLHKLSRNRIFQFFPGIPYGLPQSKVFMKACKNGEAYKVKVMLEKNKWLAHIFDYSGQTPLHWAVIRNNFEITEMLLKIGSYVDVGDYIGRTGAFIAAKNGNLKILELLYYFKSNLSIATRAGTRISDVAVDQSVKNFLLKRRLSLAKIIVRKKPPINIIY
ncbi:hypothetical protein SteCoe_6751 [Stentor coeruleus]|uniref:Uncharacterized protein n=1 Tax=Stentor coeruleus TaxID=5963 RepID=A0A1R2CP55_9CILI|nr:hypothetical protein SteCoe_6751 [Stentor coeruleus]